MLGFGVGVGAYVTGGVDGVPYLDWIVPGLIASTAMQIAVGESTWPVLGNFEWNRTYFAQAAAPLRVADIARRAPGLRAVPGAHQRRRRSCWWRPPSARCDSWWALATLPVVRAARRWPSPRPTFAYTASVTSDSYLAILIRFAVIPMSLFSGVFFPVESLPAAAALGRVRVAAVARRSTCAGPPRSASRPSWSVTGAPALPGAPGRWRLVPGARPVPPPAGRMRPRTPALSVPDNRRGAVSWSV